MLTATLGMGFILACVFLGIVTLAGVLTLFVKAESFERNELVGGLCLCTCLLAIITLRHQTLVNPSIGSWTLLGICLLAVLGYPLGWIIDAKLGPVATQEVEEDSPLGADLAD